MRAGSAGDPFLVCATAVAALSIAIALSSCGLSDSTKQMVAMEAAARHIPVTRESLPAGTYRVLGPVSVSTEPAPCHKDVVTYEALRKYGSKVDEIIDYGGGNSVGNGFYDACHGIAVQLIRKKPGSGAKPSA